MKEAFLKFVRWCKNYLYSLENGVTRYHYAFLSLFAGFCLGICPVFGFILGYNYERAKEGKADIPYAIIILASAVIGNIIKMIVTN